ncbi:MAG: hypothetical protein WC107_07980 [Patescibacteria group bacterium]|jgi:hypothetical protein
MSITHIAIDQHGNTHKLYTKFPRKELIEKLGATSAQKMYVDGKQGKSYHVGWIISGLWLTVYKVTPMRKPQQEYVK